MERIEVEAGRLLAGGALERSPQLAELFAYLVTATMRNRSPKEAEIAQDVFGRDAAFEPAQDALVRVHIHRLRSKIERFYADHPSPDGLRLAIPRGEYRLLLVSAEGAGDVSPASPEAARRGFWRTPWFAAGLLALGLVLGGLTGWRMAAAPDGGGTPSPLWSIYHRDSRTSLVIVGDHAPADAASPRAEMPEVTILPVGVATALRHVIPALASGDPAQQRLRLLPMSQVTPDMMRAANIIYVGTLADIAMIGEPLFAGSRVRPAEQGRALIDARTGQVIARAPDEQRGDIRKQSDFGYVASFAGPSGNRITVVAGGGNAGLMQAAEMVASADRIRPIMQRAGAGPDFEAVLVVTSMHDMNMGSRLILAAPLSSAAIWREGQSD